MPHCLCVFLLCLMNRWIPACAGMTEMIADISDHQGTKHALDPDRGARRNDIWNFFVLGFGRKRFLSTGATGLLLFFQIILGASPSIGVEGRIRGFMVFVLSAVLVD